MRPSWGSSGSRTRRNSAWLMRARLGARSSTTKDPGSFAEANAQQFPAVRDEFARTFERLRIIRFAQTLLPVLPLLIWHEGRDLSAWT